MTPTEPITIYLLHFTKPVNRAWHYCGSTPTRRFQRRMVEHATGQGAALTRLAGVLGVPWYIVRTWQTDNRELEKQLKREKNLKRHCLFCSTNVANQQTTCDCPKLVTPHTHTPAWRPSTWLEHQPERSTNNRRRQTAAR